MRPLAAVSISTIAALACVQLVAEARRVIRHPNRPRPVLTPGDVHFSTPFAMLDRHLARGAAPAAETRPPRSLHGSSIAALEGGALIVDADSGALVRTDRAGEVVARLELSPGAAQVAVDREEQRAYVSDRRRDRIAVVDLHGGLREVDSIDTPREPYGVALTPDGRRLLVTTVADRTLVAYRTDTGIESWRLDIGPGARGVAIRPSGDEALVTFLGIGAVARVGLGGERPTLRFTALGDERSPLEARNRRQSVPQSRARAAFAATHVAGGIGVVAYQRSTPVQVTEQAREVRGTYGGGSSASSPPIVHRLAFLSPELGAREVARAHVFTHLPRALAYDAERDTLYLAGLGDDTLIAIADASVATAREAWRRTLPARGGERCGPSGLAIADGGDVLAFCSFSRRLARVSGADTTVAMSDELGESRLSARARAGRELFHTGGDPRLSVAGAMACASCHPEGGSDGLSWRIEGHTLQTPVLAGRVAGTHPFKWDGQDPNIQTSLLSTVRRLGGTGVRPAHAKELAAFLESLPPPRSPTPRDAEAVARGERLFRSEELGCASCHRGSKYTDGKRYQLADDLDRVDTPSLLGLASSAPYYHDGSAATLRALLLENGTIHGMGRLDRLGRGDVDDLISFLETL